MPRVRSNQYKGCYQRLCYIHIRIPYSTRICSMIGSCFLMTVAFSMFVLLPSRKIYCNSMAKSYMVLSKLLKFSYHIIYRLHCIRVCRICLLLFLQLIQGSALPCRAVCPLFPQSSICLITMEAVPLVYFKLLLL